MTADDLQEAMPWRRGLHMQFQKLCDTFEIATESQAWILALTLRHDSKALGRETGLTPTDLDAVLALLTPAQLPPELTPVLEPMLDMPVGGALDPCAVSGGLPYREKEVHLPDATNDEKDSNQ